MSELDKLAQQLPSTWALATLGDLVDYGRTNKAEPDEIDDSAWVTDQEALRLAELSAALAKLGFLFDSREPLYKDFLRSWHGLRYADRPALTAEQALARRNAMKTACPKGCRCCWRRLKTMCSRWATTCSARSCGSTPRSSA